MGSLEYYALGETKAKPSGYRFIRHMAEPGPANSLSERQFTPIAKTRSVPALPNTKISMPFAKRYTDKANASQKVDITSP